LHSEQGYPGMSNLLRECGEKKIGNCALKELTLRLY
jgi:hypothetical protein